MTLEALESFYLGRQMAEAEHNDFSGERFCGNCGSAVATGATACVHCGIVIAADRVLDVLEDGYIPYCRACGVPVAREEALNCTKCGVAPLCREHFFPSTRSCALCPPIESIDQAGEGSTNLPDRPGGPWIQPAGTFPCDRCGARLRRGVGFCPNCGAEHAGVHGDSKYVGFLARLGAAVIDVITPIIATILISFIADIPGVLPVLFISYHTIFTYKLGQTPGKMLLGLQVVDADDRKPSLKQILMREVLGKVIVFLIMFVGFLWVLWDPKKRGWHDYIGGTYVIKRERH
ncbi:MAG: hypothetical protein BZY85_09525 [SAR202 cluster bacterium MP-SAtl-SRR3965592-G1]|nr:MAG: hypothetical protein BZY85_09525 [SAR202 cluster bacterium MP-SAtl-SRR3965592-G1]